MINTEIYDIEQKDNIEKIQKIIMHTNYTNEIAKQKLLEYNNNEIEVIKKYLCEGKLQNLPEKTTSSLNQEIYKQIRLKLNN